WSNVELAHCDALEYIPPEPLDGILFGLSYNTMPHHLAVLRQAWKQLRPGGRIVILDGKVPDGICGKLALPFGLWLMKNTMLGNPFIQPWKDLAALVSEANGQRGESIVRAHSASVDARERADDTRPEPGSSARAALAEDFAMEQFLFGSWYVCYGSKPLRDPVAAYPLEAEQLIAAE